MQQEDQVFFSLVFNIWKEEAAMINSISKNIYILLPEIKFNRTQTNESKYLCQNCFLQVTMKEEALKMTKAYYCCSHHQLNFSR